jgi:hypothetical protein
LRFSKRIGSGLSLIDGSCEELKPVSRWITHLFTARRISQKSLSTVCHNFAAGEAVRGSHGRRCFLPWACSDGRDQTTISANSALIVASTTGGEMTLLCTKRVSETPLLKEETGVGSGAPGGGVSLRRTARITSSVSPQKLQSKLNDAAIGCAAQTTKCVGIHGCSNAGEIHLVERVEKL